MKTTMPKNNNEESGFIIPAILLIVLLLAIAGLAWFFLARQDGPPVAERDPLLDTFEQKKVEGGSPMVLEEGEEQPQKEEPKAMASSTATSTEDSAVEKNEDSQEETERENVEDSTIEVQGEQAVAMPLEGMYSPYSSEQLANAETGDVVLFFHASWCPSCKSADASITKETIPEGLTILKVDYDSETELKKKYGVSYQHTFVQVDKQGALIKKWSGSRDLASIESEVE